uniref:Uncharacterized protein n=1 Tax=viral metagenome TaxID=1070528 RepID=A0A6C0AWM1_9ZZZZ|tara:strand:- start:5167 stop:5553 length:387 start_codon:yes stop_codon:yes gene_type:complete
MGQVLANLSSNLNIVYFEEEKMSIENHIPFTNNESENVTWDKIMSYLDKEQKFRYKIKKDKYEIIENLKVRKITMDHSNVMYWHDSPSKFEPYEDVQYYFEKGETYENTESINRLLRYKTENFNFELV